MSSQVTIPGLLLAAGSLLCSASGCCLLQNTVMKPLQPETSAQPLPGWPSTTEPPAQTFRSNKPVPIFGYTPRPQGNAVQQPIAPGNAPAERGRGDRVEPRKLPQAPAGRTPRYQPEEHSGQRPTGPGPQLLPIEPLAALALVLKVTVNERAQLGSGATFEIVVHNPTERTIDDIVIEASFDEALVFPGRPEKKIRRSLGKLAGDERRELAVMLTSEEAGRHCARFTLFANGDEAASKKTCIDFVSDEAKKGAFRF